jgi:primosomal protein N'
MVSEFCGETTNPSLCPDCLENGICPKCDKEMILTEETQSYHCPHCGWDEETGF